MTSPELLAMIRCPLTGQPLREADQDMVQKCNAAISAGGIQDHGGRDVDTPVDQLLITADGTRLYPVRGEIPTLIPDWSLLVGDLPAANQQQPQ